MGNKEIARNKTLSIKLDDKTYWKLKAKANETQYKFSEFVYNEIKKIVDEK